MTTTSKNFKQTFKTFIKEMAHFGERASNMTEFNAFCRARMEMEKSFADLKPALTRNSQAA